VRSFYIVIVMHRTTLYSDLHLFMQLVETAENKAEHLLHCLLVLHCTMLRQRVQIQIAAVEGKCFQCTI